MKRILHVTASINPLFGGVSQAIVTMTNVLSACETENEVVCLDDPRSEFLKLRTSVTYALGPGKTAWCYSHKLIPWLKSNIHNYDVVIVHGLWLYHSYAIEKVLDKERRQKNKSLKILIMPHGMLDPYFQKTRRRKLKAIRNFFYWKFLENKAVNNADGILYTSGEELRLAYQSFKPFYPRKDHVVGLGVEEPPAFLPYMTTAFLNKCTYLDNEKYFLFLSRIDPKKGVDILIEAYRQVLQQYKNVIGHIPKLVIAGPGLDSGYGKQMMEVVEQDQDLKRSVFFPGMLSGDVKWGAFYGCQAFILPSHQENFGIAVVESLSCARPVLISDKINIWREIIDEDAGFVADDSLEGTLLLFKKWFQLSGLQKQSMSINAREAYETKFAIEPVRKKLAEAVC
jgi:glycosyltransferase involved in cell wall biosynthesis